MYMKGKLIAVLVILAILLCSLLLFFIVKVNIWKENTIKQNDLAQIQSVKYIGTCKVADRKMEIKLFSAKTNLFLESAERNEIIDGTEIDSNNREVFIIIMSEKESGIFQENGLKY
ncbi:hypothetical protein EOT00_01130 [Listeria seeligeri]|uniref:DUF5502 family protein n=1 Tax=Listeria seeligeri TaxID=1640 RepID=UPI001118A328|nr:DUF5502 family protein [Listeria seeligeri]QDA73608.1 hypothetical protein EOT00_01130 [Listeria seeligeri]